MKFGTLFRSFIGFVTVVTLICCLFPDRVAILTSSSSSQQETESEDPLIALERFSKLRPSSSSDNRFSSPSSSSSSSAPTYSFVLGFGVPEVATPDFDAESMSHRLKVFVRSLDFMMGTNNVSAEVIIVQWVADPSNDLLKLIDWEELGIKSLAMVRIIEVTPEAAKLAPPCLSNLKPRTLAPKGPMCMEFVAKNIGGRRAQGEYIVLLNIDDLLTPPLAGLLATPNFWGENTYWRAVRKNIRNKLQLESANSMYKKAEQLIRKKKTPENENPILGPILANTLLEIQDLSDKSSGDFLLIRKKDFLRIEGYPELGIELHIDNMFMALATAKGMLCGGLKSPYAVMHQMHTRRGREARVVLGASSIAKFLGLNLTQLRTDEPPPSHAKPNWGLANLVLPEARVVQGRLQMPKEEEETK